MQGFSPENFLEAQYPFVRDDVFLVARVGQVSGKQHLVIRQVDKHSGKVICEEELECIHAALTEISPDDLDDLRANPENKEKLISAYTNENVSPVDLSIDECFTAFKSWVAGISEAGIGAFRLQVELENALPMEIPIAGFLMGFFARIDPDFLPTQLDYIERASWHEGIRHEAFLIANLLPILDILVLAKDRQDLQFEDTILEQIFDLDPPLALFLDMDRYLPFLLDPRALPIIEKGIEKTGLFPRMPAEEAAQAFVQEIESGGFYWGVPLVPSEISFLGKLNCDLGITIAPLDDDRWISRTGFLTRRGHITKLVISLTDQQKQAKDCIFPESIGELTALKTLQIENCPLVALPDSIGELKALQTLQIENCPLVALPGTVGLLPSLRTLSLIRTRLSFLPASIGNLESLQFLRVEGYELKSIPETIGNLTALKKLYIWGNVISYLPDSMRQLNSLRTLILHGDFKGFPSIICDITSLEELVISSSGLTTIPNDISGLSLLQKLSVIGNQISSLPESLLLCKHLHTLEFDYNSITLLPDWIGGFQSLKMLTINQNRLATIPSSIGELKALEHLDLSGNNITSFPSEIMQLSSLKGLYIDGELLSALPVEIHDWIKKRRIKTSAY